MNNENLQDDKNIEKQKLLKKLENLSLSLFSADEEFKRDEEVINKAIESDGMNLFYVPEDLRTKELCLQACKQDAYAILAVPEEYIDRNFCLEVATNDWYILKHMPKEFIDKEICLEAIKNYKLALKLVPDNFKDYEFYLDAYKINKDTLELFDSELNKNENDILFLNNLKESIENNTLDTFSQNHPEYFDGTLQRDLEIEEFVVTNTSNNGKKVIFVDFDGVLNGRVYAKDTFGMESDKIRELYRQLEKNLKNENTAKNFENSIEALFYVRKKSKKIESNLLGNGRERKDLREYSLQMTYISEETIKRLAKICEETGASVVLNGTQSRNLLNGRNTNYYLLDDDKTSLLEVMKKYNIPVEKDIAYDSEGCMDLSRIDNSKRSGVYTYLRTHPEVENFVVIEDIPVLLVKGQLQVELYRPFEDTLTFEEFQVYTDKTGLDDSKMREAIDILTKPLEFSLKDCIEEVRDSYKKELITYLRDETTDFNKIIKNINYRDLIDTDICDTLVDRVNQYEYSKSTDLESLKQYPEELKNRLQTIDFKTEPLINKIQFGQ